MRGDGGGGSQKGKGVREHLQLYLGLSLRPRRGFYTLVTPCIPPHALPRPARPTGTLHTATKCQRATIVLLNEDRQAGREDEPRAKQRMPARGKETTVLGKQAMFLGDGVTNSDIHTTVRGVQTRRTHMEDGTPPFIGRIPRKKRREA